MFIVAREFIREDGQKVAMKVKVSEEQVEITKAVAGSDPVVLTWTPLEADYLLDLLQIQDEHAGELNADH